MNGLELFRPYREPPGWVAEYRLAVDRLSASLLKSLAVLAFGDQALAPAVVMFMVSNLLHFTFGAWLLDHDIRLLSVWRVPSRL